MPLDIPKDWIGKVTVTDTACTVTCGRSGLFLFIK